MNVDDLIMVSVDDHVVEPPDVFEGRLPRKYQDLAPRLLTRDDGTNAWRYDGTEIGNVALNAVAGRPPEEYGIEPTSFDELRPGTLRHPRADQGHGRQRRARVAVLPVLPAVLRSAVRPHEDKDVALAMVQAYNDWHIDEWCGTYPGRFIPCPLPAIWDPEVMAAEVRRTAAKGAHAVTFSENPTKLGWPSVHSDHWDPFWTACSDEAVVVCMHIGSSSELVITVTGRADGRADHPDADQHRAGRRRPGLVAGAAQVPGPQVALSEGGIGWIPYFLERIDYNYQRHHYWTGQDFGDKLPSEVFNEHVITCFIDDHFGRGQPEVPGHGQRVLGMRLPPLRLHLAAGAGDVAQADGRSRPDRHRPHEPSQRHAPLPLRPLRRAPREDCTVGALRRRAAGHDVSIRPRGKRGGDLKLAAQLGQQATGSA